MLNVYGRTQSLRNPDVYRARGNVFPNDITLTEKQFYEAISRHGESDAEYIIKATDAVNRGLAHYSQNGMNLARYYFLPPSENYLLWFSRYVSLAWKIPLGSSMRDIFWYRFADWRKTVERGVGLCGAHAQVLMEVLHLNHIPAQVVYLWHHVVVAASPDGGKTWWTLDPDDGVVMPESVQALRANPEALAGYYKTKGFDAASLKGIQEVYSNGTPEFKYSIMEMHGRGKVYFEYASYYLIWVVPIALMLPLLVDFSSILRQSPARLKIKLPLVGQTLNQL